VHVVVDKEDDAVVEVVQNALNEICSKMSYSPSRLQPSLAGCMEFYATSDLSEDEIERMQGLLGVGRTIQYLQIKQDLTNKVKSLLISPEAKGKTEDKPQATMPTPKIIEEK
jgi:hypothetical protein